MSVKKIMREMDPEEIVGSFVLPVNLTKKERQEADEQLAEARKTYGDQLTKREYLEENLLQLDSQLQDYVKSDNYHPHKRFGDFLKAYLIIIDKKSIEFAREINIHETLVSQLIHNHRQPNEDIMVRIELHSGNSLQAHHLYMLVQKEHVNQLKTDKNLRKREKKNVKYKLKVSK